MKYLKALWSYLTETPPDPYEAEHRQRIAARAFRNREREMEARRLSDMARERSERRSA